MRRTILLSILLIVTLFQTVLAQSRSISGRVTDQKTGEGLPGATILLKGTTTGVSTSIDGRFTLDVPGSDGVLVISSVGMVAQEVAVGSRTTFDIALATDPKELNEVVVTGFGTQQSRSELTGSVASVKSSQFQNLPLASVDQALQGRAAGVQVTQNSGTPGSGIAVRIRGISSINGSNEPLYVVDGLPLTATGSFSNIGVGNQGTNALADINPNDIASIEVLKDAAAASLYGSRGTNGVVLITTKRGRAGKTDVNLNYYQGFQNIVKRPMPLSGQQQTELFLEMLQNRYPATSAGVISAFGVPWRSYADMATYVFGSAGLGTISTGQYIAQPTGRAYRDLSTFQNPSTAPSTNWGDQVLRTAPVANYELSFAGGTGTTRFRASAGYFDQRGIILGSGFSRASARVTVDNDISKKVKTGLTIALNRSVSNRINNDNNINGVLSAAVLVASDIPVYNPNGTYAKDPGASTENPVVAAVEPNLTSVSARLIGSQFTEFELIKNLKYRATFGLDYLTFKDDTFLPTTTNTGFGTNGSAVSSYRQNVNIYHFSSITYDKTFADAHTISAQAVVEFQNNTLNETFATATGFPGNTIRQLSAGAQKTGASSSQSVNRLLGGFIRATYEYRSRYILSASIRRDASSVLGVDNRVGNFPGVSAAWRVSEEDFLKENRTLNDVKLRVSYGVTGNARGLSDFGSLGLISAGNNYIQTGGLALSQLENRNLGWERANSIDIGLDFGLFANRIVFTGDLYRRDTKELLLPRLLAGNTGFLSYSANLGTMRNDGIELGLNTVNIQAKEANGFEWTTNFNITFNRNRVTALVIPPFASGFANWVEEGQPIGAFRGYVVDGIFQSQGEIDAANANAVQRNGAGSLYQASLTRPGDIRFRDLNGDGRITGDDQQIIGNAQPNYYGGFTNTLRFMGFDLTAFLQYNVGNQIYSNTRSFAEGMNAVFGQSATVLNRWTPTNTNTDIPRAVYGDPNNNRRVSDRFIESGSYARLKNVVLGYSLPRTLASKLKLTSARIYVQAQNLVTFTSYSGLDPEINTFSGSNTALGTDFLTFPQARTFTGGITLGF
jgi:TonB-linked SusC/RagA family outer membrane protein